jgi:hypothetical protein
VVETWPSRPTTPRQAGHRLGKSWTHAVALFVTLCASGPLRADETPADKNDETRPLPDYDGRPKRTTAGDVALWVPRVVLFPLYLVTDFLVRRPLGFVITGVERGLSGSGGGSSVYFVPTFNYERGLTPTLGVHAWSDRFISEDNELRGRASFWGPDALSFAVLDRLTRGPVLLSAGAGWARRPDYVFYGIGSESRDADRSRFHASRFDAQLGAAFTLAPPLTIAVRTALRDVRFDDGTCCDDPALADRIAAGFFPAPHGFDHGVSALVERVELAVDNRTPGTSPRFRARFTADVENGSDLRSSSDDWLAYGATLDGFVDLTGRARVLDLSLTARFVRPLSGTVPFTELVSLGGADMPGFLEGRLLGESAITAMLRYEWPVWVWLRGSLTAEVGNVFGRDLEGFAAERLRMSFTMGFRSIGRDAGLQVLFGVGTDPFDAGTGVSSVRFTIGGFSGW